MKSFAQHQLNEKVYTLSQFGKDAMTQYLEGIKDMCTVALKGIKVSNGKVANNGLNVMYKGVDLVHELASGKAPKEYYA
jgi:hypothetical protein